MSAGQDATTAGPVVESVELHVAAGAEAAFEAAVAEAEERYVATNPESRRLAEAARNTLPGGNTRTTLFFSPFPLYMAGGKGSTLTDVDSHTYVDFVNEYTAGLFGHSHPVVKQAIEQAKSRPVSPVYSLVSAAIYKNVNAALSGSKTPEQALKDADAGINKALKTF